MIGAQQNVLRVEPLAAWQGSFLRGRREPRIFQSRSEFRDNETQNAADAEDQVEKGKHTCHDFRASDLLVLVHSQPHLLARTP